MKRIWFILRLSMVVIAVLFPASLLAAGQGGPKILIPETTWDYGKIPEGNVVSHVYWIKNTGSDTLKITEVKTSCGCTKAPLKKKELASGDSTDVEVIFTAGSFTGNVGKTASISSNDTAFSKVQVSFKGELVANFDSTTPITISPSKIDFGGPAPGNGNSRKLVIKNVSPAEITVDVLDSPQGTVKLDRYEFKIKPGKAQEVKIDLKEESKGIELKKSITLGVNGDKTLRFTVPLLKSGLADAAGGPPKK